VWGAAKFSAALIVFLALLGHILGLSFIQFGERPRMEKLYDRGLRQDAGLLVRKLEEVSSYLPHSNNYMEV
jgi:phosphatidylethanolamine N-methyltransferase